MVQPTSIIFGQSQIRTVSFNTERLLDGDSRIVLSKLIYLMASLKYNNLNILNYFILTFPLRSQANSFYDKIEMKLIP